ncbi:MAG: ATP-binding cassette domain-containing protein [Eubacteriales bacterium]|nr:ATP-binding cassette domain-containing protein [Eubacteriales bacterium]MDD4768506.1 ATP-binding cassette domain-containing protein [Eubacteriales bacterium]
MSEIIVSNLNKHYGRHHILKNVSFSFKVGEIVGFIGPNGSGKSTTMKCIANLIFPDKNSSIRIAGFDLFKSRNQALSHLSALIESPGLYYNLSGLDNLKLFANLRKISKQRLEEVIEFSGLGHALKKKASDYSMGMKQRLALAIAILPNPTFLILDEPFNGLDPQGVFDLREVIKGLAKEGCGILFSSHQLLEMEKISSRNVFIKAGEIVSQEHAQAEAAVLSYRLFLDREDRDQEVLNNLKNASVLKDFEADEHELVFTLTDIKHCSQVLTALLTGGRELKGIMPLTANIENLYNSIYKPGAN